MRVAFLFLALLSLSACSKDDFAYELSENGCSTGKQSFDSKEAMCEGLRSDSRNNGATCAAGLRKEKYEKECGGTFSRSN